MGPFKTSLTAALLALWLGAPAQAGTATTEEADLPLKGLSQMDRFAYRGKAGFDIPYPFEKLRHALAQFNSDETVSQSTLLVPVGRSLQKPLSADPNPFEFPRVLFSLGKFETRGEFEIKDGFAGGRSLSNKMFVAFHEPRRQLEVISWNEELGRYEFQIVRNYGPGLRPELFYAHRSLCMSCHVKGGPIFPSLPWDETNANEGIAALIRKARTMAGDPSNFYQGVRIEEEEGDRAAKIPERSEVAQGFENSVLLAEWTLRSQKIWASSCLSATDKSFCRRRVLEMTLLQGLAESPGDVLDRSRNSFLSQIGTPKPEHVFISARDPLFQASEAFPSLKSLRNSNKVKKFGLELFEATQAEAPGERPFKRLAEILIGLPLTAADDPQVLPVREPSLAKTEATFSLQTLALALTTPRRRALLAKWSADLASVEGRDPLAQASFELSPDRAEAPLVFTLNDSDRGTESFSFTSTRECDAKQCEFKVQPDSENDESQVARSVVIESAELASLEPRWINESFAAQFKRDGVVQARLECVRPAGAKITCYPLRLRALSALFDQIEEERGDILASTALPTSRLLDVLIHEDASAGKNKIEASVPQQVAPTPSTSALLASATHPAVKAVLQNCSRCHFGEESEAPTLFKGESELEILQSLKESAPRMAKRLASTTRPMPPRSSKESADLNSQVGEREKLIEILEALESPGPATPTATATKPGN